MAQNARWALVLGPLKKSNSFVTIPGAGNALDCPGFSRRTVGEGGSGRQSNSGHRQLTRMIEYGCARAAAQS